MGGSTQQATTTSGSSNPQINSLVSNLAGKTNAALDAGAPAVFNKSLYGGVGDTTKNSWASVLGAAGNPDYASGIGGAISSLGNAAAGNAYGMNDPGYAALRAKAGDDALTSVNSVFNNSGRLGGGSNVKAAGEGVTNALSGMDYANFQNDRTFQQQAASMLPALFQGAQLPGATQGAVGAAQDADTQASLLGQNDLQQRTGNANTDYLAKITSMLGGQAPAGGQTSTSTTPSPPWWMGLLGTAASLA